VPASVVAPRLAALLPTGTVVVGEELVVGVGATMRMVPLDELP
jgi:lipopolysaccharide/colanic/teichoic acid biosynthesis glycosyltransferase